MRLIINEIQNDILSTETDLTLLDEVNFNSRTDAIDFLDFHVLDRIEGLMPNIEFQPELSSLKVRAEAIKHALESINTGLFKQIRKNIITRKQLLAGFKSTLIKYLGDDVFESYKSGKPGYDNADVFINGLVIDQPLPYPTTGLNTEMVFYQQTPARIIFQLAEASKLTVNDVFFDLGSGLGQVSILINLLTGATTKGVEYEPAYGNYATAYAAGLDLSDVEFINADTRGADYSTGTVFFMYTPFTGSILQDVLAMLKKESLSRQIKIFTYGPCSPVVAREDWLQCPDAEADDIYQLYEFSSFAKTEEGVS